MIDSAACVEQGGKNAGQALCAVTWCSVLPGAWEEMPRYECDARKGTAVTDDHCVKVCCAFTNGTWAVVSEHDCGNSLGAARNVAECVEVCCRFPEGNCCAPKATPTCGNGACEDCVCEKNPLCCDDSWGSPCAALAAECGAACLCTKPGDTEGNLVPVPVPACTGAGSQFPIAAAVCKNTVCCELDGGIVALPALECTAGNGIAVADDACREVAVWVAEHSLKPGEPCEPERLLAVPSSGTDKLTIYGTDTLEPLAKSPFRTCKDPSRILMDANTDIIATCRGDGKVWKHSRFGKVLWDTHLPGCGAARGVVITPAGRLFVGCSKPSAIHELHAATGGILASLALPNLSLVYGLAADAFGVYVASLSDKVAKMTLTSPGGKGDLEPAWTVTKNAFYGIATDGKGMIWTSAGSTLASLDTTSGLVVDSYSLSSSAYGVSVAPNGRVYAALGGMDRIAYVTPPDPGVTEHLLPASDDHPHGVAIDAHNVAYAINLESHTVTRVMPDGAATSFGAPKGAAPFLKSPYSYNGDSTGVTICTHGHQDTWYSPVTDGKSSDALWLGVSWTSTEPPGTGIASTTRSTNERRGRRRRTASR